MNAFEYFRKKANLTQREVAESLGLDQTTVSRWECGYKMPRADRLLSIAGLYRCSVEDLLRPRDPNDS
ncbi:MAG: helix-turn-helix transcriptional regulator [Oscillospiraceae bacterium]|nr:helix-turn-helix transcriptional regulator [Oscillospiraceae bacterium]